MKYILPSFVLGFHGCDLSTKEKILRGKDSKLLQPSKNDYDWLGSGIYFWENDPERAFSYAQLIKENPKRCSKRITKPAVLGAVIELGYCLNLFEQDSLQEVKQAYQFLQKISPNSLPSNQKGKKGEDLLLRFLDKMVIDALHQFRKENKKRPYDTIRCPFWEGDLLYPTAGFREKNHVQLCVINPEKIKCFFDPDIHY